MCMYLYYVVCIDTLISIISFHIWAYTAVDYSHVALVCSFHCYIVFHHR